VGFFVSRNKKWKILAYSLFLFTFASKWIEIRRYIG
jgi:hypothetical protein